MMTSQWSVNFLLAIRNAVQIQSATGPFLSFCTASEGGQLEFAPAASSVEAPLTFNITSTAFGLT